jgi:hypothetical protein
MSKRCSPDVVCEHGVAMDVHCCGCHSGFLFDVESCTCLTRGTEMTLSLHRCKVCGTRWLLWPEAIHGGGWNLLDQYQRPGSCCDNVAMGDQIEPLRDFELRPPSTTITYRCGCVAVGRNLPSYCPEHDTAGERLQIAAENLYRAGRWSTPRLSDSEQAALWEALRDALGLNVGTATALGVDSAASELATTVDAVDPSAGIRER